MSQMIRVTENMVITPIDGQDEDEIGFVINTDEDDDGTFWCQILLQDGTTIWKKQMSLTFMDQLDDLSMICVKD